MTYVALSFSGGNKAVAKIGLLRNDKSITRLFDVRSAYQNQLHPYIPAITH